MQIDIKSLNIKPIRQTYSHVARRIGPDKPASRYQEATFDLQPTTNFHYRPTWQPQYTIYDENRTAIVMDDWYKLLDPRQYYYGNYVMARARQQDAADQNFTFVEKRGLLDLMPDEVKQEVIEFIMPLRHYEWGANMNNTQICTFGYGTAITGPAMFQAADRLGMAQYITRIGLLLSGNETDVLDKAKESWLHAGKWQGLRHVVEDSFVVEDWFELYLLQNFVLDGMLHPLFFDRYEQKLNRQGGAAQAMLTEFMSTWYTESCRWVDKQLSVAAAESDANRELLTQWYGKWIDRACESLMPLAAEMLEDGQQVLDEIRTQLDARASKIGING
ncbi:MAG: aromatic/alkene monooxygenase hydroxylase subunit beta [Proteobacteria bacterium]|nr:aromatic/alkene monooxygenase hydroxylase subunit beta [Pseudomonadota bacterium]